MSIFEIVNKYQLKPIVTTSLLVAMTATYVIAQTIFPSIKIEPEQGTITGQAAVVADSLSSNGSYLGFNATSQPPQPGVLWSEDFTDLADMNNLIGQGGDGVSLTNQPVSSSNGHDAMTFHADHDDNCGAPTTYRNITGNNTWQRHSYWCPNGTGHFMTALNNTSYVSFGFSPRGENNKAKIFPASANKICFDVNITGLGNRRWWDITVVSEAKYFANSFPVNVSGQPGGAITTEPVLFYIDPNHAVPGLAVGYDAEFHLVEAEGGLSIASNGQWIDGTSGPNAVVNRFITDKASRFKTCVKDNGNNTVTFTQARPDGSTRTNVLAGAFPRSNKVFIVQDKTYNADKAENPAAVSDPYTWHWDNMIISAE